MFCHNGTSGSFSATAASTAKTTAAVNEKRGQKDEWSDDGTLAWIRKQFYCFCILLWKFIFAFLVFNYGFKIELFRGNTSTTLMIINFICEKPTIITYMQGNYVRINQPLNPYIDVLKI